MTRGPEAAPSPDDEPREVADPRASEGPTTPRWRRFAPLAILAGGGLATWLLSPNVPHDRVLELRVADPTTVTSIEVAWSRDGAGEQGASLRFDQGAPRSVRAPVRLPDGRHQLDITLTRRDASPSTTHRAITLRDSDDVIVDIR